MKHLIISTCLVLSAFTAEAQTPSTSAESTTPEGAALATCTASAAAKNLSEAQTAGRIAESIYRKRLAQNPRDVIALVGAARALSVCILPSADFMSQGELSSEALDLLEKAIEIDPANWTARFVLASISDRSPAFLGRGKRAAKEYDELLRMQGERTDNPVFARVFEARGRQLSREGQLDSARALWARGARLFPDDSALKALSAERPTASGPVTPVLAQVEVVASAAPAVPLPSVKTVSRSDVLMTAGGAADILQAVQMQPGATRVTEGGDIYTRGGDAGETSLIVNGGRVLGLSRFEGLNGSMFGAIEPFVVKTVRYSSGGFSARHGNALSGVLEIETDGRPRERQTRAGVSLVQASGTIRGPINPKAGGWISSRVSHTGALLRTHGRADEFDGAPHSEEMIGSLIVNPTQLSEVRATAIVERDASNRYLTAAGWEGGFASRGSTRALLLSSRWISSTMPLVLRGSFAGTTRSSDWSFGVLSRERDEASATSRVDAEWEANAGLMVRAGIEHAAHRRRENGTVPVSASVAPGSSFRTLDDLRSSADQVGLYAETELASGGTSLTVGGRADRLPGETGITVDPRIALSQRIGEWTARLSGGVFHQGRWRGDAAIPDAGMPSGLPRSAGHAVAGIERSTASLFIRGEAFIKRYADYRAFGAGPSITGSTTRGLDAIAQRTTGKVTGFVGYSLLDATSRLHDERRVRGAFDIRHSATGSITASLNRHWSVGTTARYGSGAPRTPILGGATTADGRIEPVYGKLMSETLPAYARVDTRLMRYIRTRSFLLTTFAEILNVTDRANVAAFTYDPTYTMREPVHTFFAKRTIVIGGEVMFR